MAEDSQDAPVSAAASSPFAYFKKVLSKKSNPSWTTESQPSKRFNPNESIHDEDSSPERVKPSPRQTKPSSRSRGHTTRRREIKPIYDDEDGDNTNGDDSNRATDDEPTTPPPKSRQRRSSPPNQPIPFISNESSPMKSNVNAPVPSPLALGAFAVRNSSGHPGSTPTRVSSFVGASPRPQNLVSLPGTRSTPSSTSFVYPSPASSNHKVGSRSIDLPRSSNHSTASYKTSMSLTKTMELGGDSDREIDEALPSVLFPPTSPTSVSPPQNPVTTLPPPIPTPSPRNASQSTSSPPVLDSSPQINTSHRHNAPDSPPSSGFGVSQMAESEPILPSSPIQDDVDEEEAELEQVVHGDEVSEVAETPAHSFSEHPADQSVVDSEGDIIETSPVGSPRRLRIHSPSKRNPSSTEGIDVVDIDEFSYESTPVDSGFHTLASPSILTSPFANRFMTKQQHQQHVSADADAIIPNAAHFDDVENSFEQMASQDDSDIPPPSIEDDIFASLAAEEAELAANAEAAALMDPERGNSISKRFQSIKDKNTQIWQRTINGAYAQIPQTSSGLHKRAHDIGKSLFLHGRRSLESFILKNITGAAAPLAPPTGAPDASLLVQILDICEDSSIKGLWKAKSRLVLEDADGALTFRFARMLLRNGLGHDVDPKLKAPAQGSWIIAMPLSRVTLIEKSNSDDSVFITVMCASWTATTPEQCLRQLDEELKLPIADLLAKYNILDTNANGNAHKPNPDLMEVQQSLESVSVAGRVVALHRPDGHASMSSRKREIVDGPSSQSKRAKPTIPAMSSQVDLFSAPSSLPASLLSATDAHTFTPASEQVSKYMADFLAKLSLDHTSSNTSTASCVVQTDSNQLIRVSTPFLPENMHLGSLVSIDTSLNVSSIDFVSPKNVSGSSALLASAASDQLSSHATSVLEISLDEPHPHKHVFLNESQSQQQQTIVSENDAAPDTLAPPQTRKTIKLDRCLRVPIINADFPSEALIQTNAKVSASIDNVLLTSPLPLHNLAECASSRANIVCKLVSSTFNINRWVTHNATETFVVYVTDHSLSTGVSVLLTLTETAETQFIEHLRKGKCVGLSDVLVNRNRAVHLVADARTALVLLPNVYECDGVQNVGDLLREGCVVHRVSSQVFRIDIIAADDIQPTQPFLSSQFPGELYNSSFAPSLAPPQFALGALVLLQREWFGDRRMEHFVSYSCVNCDSKLLQTPAKHHKLLGRLFCKRCNLRCDDPSGPSAEEKDCVIVFDYPHDGAKMEIIGAPYEHSLSSQIDDRFPLAARFKAVVVAIDRGWYQLMCLMQGE